MADDRAVPMTEEERKAFRAELAAEQRAADEEKRKTTRRRDPRERVDPSTEAQAAGPTRAARSREERRRELDDEIRGDRPLTASERQARALLGRS